MNPPAEDFKDLLLLSSLGTGLVFKTDLFVAFEPDIENASPIVTLYDVGGDRPEFNLSGYNYYEVRVQARIRGAEFGYQAAYTVAETVRDALHDLSNQTVNSTRYILISASTDIFAIGFDENNRPIFTVNFLAHRTV